MFWKSQPNFKRIHRTWTKKSDAYAKIGVESRCLFRKHLKISIKIQKARVSNAYEKSENLE